MYFKVGEPVLVQAPQTISVRPGTTKVVINFDQYKVGIIIEKYNTPQLQRQMKTSGGRTLHYPNRTTYEGRTHWHSNDLKFSPRAFNSYDVQYRDYISKFKTPKSGRWHKYYVVMIGDNKKIYMYKDLKKMHKHDI